MVKRRIKIVGFDADNVLWVNEPIYFETGRLFCEIPEPYLATAETPFYKLVITNAGIKQQRRIKLWL